jgi:high-affinity iron transporter
VLGALIIVFREVFEAGLIVGIVMAVTRAVAYRGWWISGGVLAGVAGACLVALFARALSSAFGGFGQEMFNASILSVAVAEMHAVGEAVAAGSRSLFGLAIVVTVAVLREGVEVVLFLYGIIASGGESSFAIFIGGVAGLILGGLVCMLMYLGLLTIPTRYLFAVTSIMIAFLAAGMAAQAAAFLEQAGTVTALGTVVWDTSWLLSEKSILGRTLHTLVGYADQPTIMQLLIYLATLAVIFVLMRLNAPEPIPHHAGGPVGRSL